MEIATFAIGITLISLVVLGLIGCGIFWAGQIDTKVNSIVAFLGEIKGESIVQKGKLSDLRDESNSQKDDISDLQRDMGEGRK